MKILSGSSNVSLARAVAEGLNVELLKAKVSTFPDKENKVKLPKNTEDFLVFQSTGISPNRNYIELFFILDALPNTPKTVVMPYVGYSRQNESFTQGEAIPLRAIGKILKELGVVKLICVDLHKGEASSFFDFETVNISAVSVFADKITQMNLNVSEATLVAPDKGSFARVTELSKALGMPASFISKKRNYETEEIESMEISGEVRPTAILVDDIISTGGTALKAASLLKQKGASKVYFFATHGIFAGDASVRLEESIIDKVFITNSLEVPAKRKFNKLEILSISDLLVRALK